MFWIMVEDLFVTGLIFVVLLLITSALFQDCDNWLSWIPGIVFLTGAIVSVDIFYDGLAEVHGVFGALFNLIGALSLLTIGTLLGCAVVVGLIIAVVAFLGR